MALDKGTKYSYFDKSETYWKFSYEVMGDDKGWFAFRALPGERLLAVGRITELEIEKLLQSNRPLEKDDLIDLELWMVHGGLEVPKKSKKKEATK